MKKLTHSESEIVKSVNELEAGVSADEICRRLNVSRATLYQWKRNYGGLEVSQLKKLKELEEENAKLKKMYANLALDNEILREVIEKTLEPNGTTNQPRMIPRSRLRYGRRPRSPTRAFGKYSG